MSLALAFSEFAEIGPRPDVIEILIQALSRPVHTIEAPEDLRGNPAIPHSVEVEAAYFAAFALGKLGGDASEALPALMEFYESLDRETADEKERQGISDVEEAIMRIHEGL
jgi:hypothetical protein